MANLTQEATEAVVREAPEVLSLTREAWSAVMNKPELRKLLQKFDVTPSSTGKMTIKLSGEQEADSLAATLKGATTTPPSGAGRGPEMVDGAKFEFQTTVDPSKLPAVYKGTPPSGSGDFTVADPARFTMNDTAVDPSKLPATVPTDAAKADVPWNKPTEPLKNVLKAGAGVALVGGAAYGAMKAGSASTEQPAAAAPVGPAPGTAAGADATKPTTPGDVATTPAGAGKREAPKVAAPYIPDSTGELRKELRKIDADLKNIKDLDWTQTDEDRWNQKMTDIQAIADRAQERNMWGQVAERVGHALTQLFAAKQGLARGVDMSGLKFDKTDWDKRSDQILDRLKADIGVTQDQKTGARETVKTARAALDRLKERRLKVAGDISKMDQDRADANARLGLDADKANQGATIDVERLDSEEQRNRDRIDGATRAAMLKSLAGRIKDDTKKRDALRKVMGYIRVSNDPDNIADKDVERAMRTYIESGLGEAEDFEAMLPQVDPAKSWDSDSEQKANWERLIEEKVGFSAGPADVVEKNRQVHPGTGQTKIFYTDGSVKIFDKGTAPAQPGAE